MRRPRLVIALATLTAMAVLSLTVPRAGTTSAHSVLVRSSPASQEQLRSAPPVIDLWFSEPLEPEFSRLELYRSDATRVELVGMRLDAADPQHLSALTPELGPGIYTIVYRTLSTRDGHEWSGSLTFTVLTADGSVPFGGGYEPALGSATLPSEVIGRWLTFAAFAVLVGAALIAALAALDGGVGGPLAVWSRRAGLHLSMAALPLAFGGALLQLLARQETLGGGLLDLLSTTRFGYILTWRLGALIGLTAALGAAVVAARRRKEKLELATSSVAAVMTLTGIATISLLSHAAAAPGSSWAVAADFVHLLVAAAWVGGVFTLASLLLSLRGSVRTFPIGGLVARFSLFATAGLGVLAATGLLRTVGEVPTLDTLLRTSYGKWLMVKLLVLLLALDIALRHRSALAQWRRGVIADAELRRRLTRWLPVEAALTIVLLGTVAVLGQLAAPRGAAGTGQPASIVPSDVNLIEVVDDLTVHLQVTPAVVGSNELRIHLYHADGSPIGAVERVQIVLGLAGGGGDTLDAAPVGDDIYSATAAVSSLAMNVGVAVDVRRERMDDGRVNFSVPIQLGAPRGETTGSLSTPAPQLSKNFLVALLLLPLGASMLVLGIGDGESRRFRGGSPTRRRAANTGRYRTAGALTVFVAIVLGISGSPHSHGGGPSVPNPLASDPTSIERGRVIYQTDCTSCHGVSGRGDGPLAQTLSPPPADLALHIPLHPEGDTFSFIANGFPNTAMPAWSQTLSDDQIWDVVNYLRSEFAE